MARRSLALAGAAFVILAAAAWAWLHSIADPATLRQMVHDRARQAFSRDLDIGDISLELLPWPSLVARKLSLMDPDPSARPELAAESARAFIALMPLFSGRVSFDSFDVEDADWQLGKATWHLDRLHIDGDDAMRTFRVEARGRALGNEAAQAADVDARVDANPTHDDFQVRDASVALGALRMRGNAHVSLGGGHRTVEARIAGGRLDWSRAMLDLGHPRPPPLAPDQLLRDTPLGWHLLEALKGWQGSLDADFDSVRMGNGIEWQRFTTHSTFEGDHWNLHSFRMGLLGGNAKGSLELDGSRHFAHLRFDGDGLQLERWFHERGSQVPFRGGPMKVTADFEATGLSLQDLGAHITGDAKIRMGPGVLRNPKAGAAEAKLTGDDPNGEDGIRFACAAGHFPFRNGRAARSPLVAARSDIAWLVTSGDVDFRDGSLELRGRVKPLKPRLGLSAIAGDVLISGKLRHPHIQHDASRTPAAVGRAGAAIATFGLSALATAATDAAAGHENDPCAAVF